MKENEKPIIIIEEKPDNIPGQGEGEVPTIVVERDHDDVLPQTPRPSHNWLWVIVGAVVTGLCCLAIYFGWRHYRNYVNIGVPVAVTSQQNIEKLQTAINEPLTPEVVKTTDSILGVSMNFYELRGLEAEISMFEPDTTDTSVYLYSRCSDYHKDFSIISSLVVAGEEIETVDGDRLGYFAGADGNYVIGIARDEAVKEYVKERRGCFFRQYILLSAGVMPRQFYLHGKVERRGIGRMPDDKLYYIETCHKETMWDFADAIREYGFVDAIYITGGYDYCYYRSADGQIHHVGNPESYPHKNQGQIPWVIFRKKANPR